MSPGLLALLVLCFTMAARPVRGDEEAVRGFDRNVAPLVARRCLDCHNGGDRKGGLDLSRAAEALRGGDSGAVIVPGNPDESLLWQYVDGDEMPPKKPLPDDEKQVLRHWIAGGARWGTDPIDRFRFTTESRAGYDWWALQELAPVAPAHDGTAGRLPAQGNAIDAFIAARLNEQGLSLAPRADRRTLIRRLSFDLLGLPPTPAEVRAFVEDAGADAYPRLVDRLLASPRYGERWARHWLDVVRFGESQGFERDKLRSNSWRYRDWVIDALNHDMPYDQFVRLQLAGDVLRPDDPAAIVATGFLVAGPYDEVGQSQQSAAMKAVVRQDELEDIVSAVGQTFLGLTVNCARCHDHKFDPVLQSEYYQLTAALAGVRHGQRPLAGPAIAAANDRAAASLAARLDQLQRQIDALEGPIRARILARRKENFGRQKPPQPLARWDFDEDFRDALGPLDGQPQQSPRLDDGRLHVDGKSFVATAPLAKDLREKTLTARLRLSQLDQRGGGVISLQTLGGGAFDAIVFGEKEPRRWMAGSNGFVRTQSFQGPAEETADRELVHVAIVYHGDGTIAGYRNGQPYGQPYQSDGPLTFAAGQAQVVFGLRHSPPGGNRFLSAAIDQAALYDRALSADEVAAAVGVMSDFVADADIVAQLSDEQRGWREQLRFEIEQLTSQQQRYREAQVYAVTPRPPETTHVLLRGNPATKGPVVAAGGVKALAGAPADFALPPAAADADRRRKLAEWITHHRNPLFARVIVNRLWHYHFGVGLVDTPNDFGFNGGRPSHPELIDFLAGELIRRDFQLKPIHRLIVNSAAYQQSSQRNPAAAQVDAGNRLLWRKTPRRLEAEALRDAVLAVAGQLNGRLHGPGYHDFRTFNFNSQFYEMLDPVGPTFHRRSLYRTWVRSGRSAFLDVFDCPDPSAKAPQRAVTTTPLQALALLNNSFVLRMSQQLAERAQREAGDGPGRQIGRVYQLAFGREPAADELAAAAPFVDQHGLAAFCRVVFNSNEFLYVD